MDRDATSLYQGDPSSSDDRCSECSLTLRTSYHEEPVEWLICQECDIVICHTCGCLQESSCEHPLKSLQDVAQNLREESLSVLEKVKVHLAELELTLRRLPSLRPNKTTSTRPVNRSTSNTSASSTISHSVSRGSSLKQRSLGDLKTRLTRLSDQLDELSSNSSPSAIHQLRDLNKSSISLLWQMSSSMINGSPTLSSSSSICSSSKSSALSRSSSSRKGTYGRSISYGDRPTSATSHTSLRSGYVCSITSGLEKEGFVSCTPGEETKLKLIVWSKDIRSRPPSGTDCIQGRLEALSVDKTENTVPNVAVRQIRADSFELSFTLHDATLPWRLHITLLGTPINGSPFIVVTKKLVMREEAVRQSLFAPVCSRLNGSSRQQRPGSPKSRMAYSAPALSNRISEVEEEDLLMLSIGSYGRVNGHFLNPQGICVTDDELIAVTDSQLGIIQLFTAEGHFVKRIGQRGRKPGQLLRPTGIAFGPKCINQWHVDIFVVADYENRTIVVLDMNGTVVATFGSSILTGPKGVAVASNGDILVVDNRSNHLVIFRNCKLFKKAWTPSSSQANLAGPHYVTISRASGEIFVSDFHHHSIKVFDQQYNYRWAFGSFNADGGMGSFSGPTGIAVDDRGLVVADWGSGRVQLFDHSGSFLSFVTYAKPLYGPQGLALGQDGSIFVCDPGNHCVRLFRHPLDSTIPSSISSFPRNNDSESSICS